MYNYIILDYSSRYKPCCTLNNFDKYLIFILYFLDIIQDLVFFPIKVSFNDISHDALHVLIFRFGSMCSIMNCVIFSFIKGLTYRYFPSCIVCALISVIHCLCITSHHELFNFSSCIVCALISAILVHNFPSCIF